MLRLRDDLRVDHPRAAGLLGGKQRSETGLVRTMGQGERLLPGHRKLAENMAQTFHTWEHSSADVYRKGKPKPRAT